jgi:hypothetical protein
MQIKQFTREKPQLDDLELLFCKNKNTTGFKIEIKIKATSTMTTELTNYLAVNIAKNIKQIFNNYEPLNN